MNATDFVADRRVRSIRLDPAAWMDLRVLGTIRARVSISESSFISLKFRSVPAASSFRAKVTP
jgi:hypothetical protein